MLITRRNLCCDICKFQLFGIAVDTKAKEIRKYARDQQWHITKANDYCPKCKDKT